MVDEKLDDQVWVTVVATGYGDEGRRKSVSRLTEPAGEPSVAASGAPRADAARPRRPAVDELDVPEFLPNSLRPSSAWRIDLAVLARSRASSTPRSLRPCSA